jgi:hypothetical protein
VGFSVWVFESKRIFCNLFTKDICETGDYILVREETNFFIEKVGSRGWYVTSKLKLHQSIKRTAIQPRPLPELFSKLMKNIAARNNNSWNCGILIQIIFIWSTTKCTSVNAFTRHQETFEDTKGVIRNCKPKGRQHNGHKRDKRKNNDLQKTLHRKLKIEQHEHH